MAMTKPARWGGASAVAVLALSLGLSGSGTQALAKRYSPATVQTVPAAERRTLTMTPLRSVRHHKGRVFALTIDDGPSKSYTHPMLAVLKKHHVHATFCLIGAEVAGLPGRVGAEVNAGHRICDHTYDHDEQLETKPTAVVRRDIARARTAIKKAKPSAKIYYYRSPGGNFGPKQDRVAIGYGMQPLSWDIDPNDWRNPPAATIYHRLITHLHPGAIILVHDGGGPRSNTVHAVDRFLRYAAKHHYRAVFPT